MSGLDAGQGGVYRVLAPVEDVASQLRAAGWQVAVLPEVGRTADFYAAFKEALDLPDWTGANLDALWDVLTDLAGPTAVVWQRSTTFATARPERWQKILAVLEARAEQDPPFALVLT